MRDIGIELISVLGLPPVEFVHLAADLGCRFITLCAAPVVLVPGVYPAWSLADDPALRRAVKSALAERGVALSGAEGFIVMPGRDIADQAADMDVLAELGTPSVNAIGLDPDPGRSREQFAAFAALAAERGLNATVEFSHSSMITDLASAVDLVRTVGRPNFRIAVDPMHHFRGGGTCADLARLDPALIGYVQLCDSRAGPPGEGYSQEARYERLAPCDGDLPLRDFLALMPDRLVVGLELPSRAALLAGIPHRDRLAAALATTRRLTQSIAARHSS